MWARVLTRYGTISSLRRSARSVRELHTPPELQRAIDTVTSIPEVVQASTTSDATEAQQLLSRTLAIVSKNSQHGQEAVMSRDSAVAHTLLAHHYRRIGDVEQERRHRLAALPSIADALPGAHIALALCCMRSPGGEGRLAAAAAARNGEMAAIDERERLTASLVSALAGDVISRRMLLSGLAAAAEAGGEPDVGGLASYVLSKDALRGNCKGETVEERKELEGALDGTSRLVERWDGRGFELVEALILRGEITLALGGRDGADEADKTVTKALKVIERIGGGRADKAEALLALAKHATVRGSLIEAEGLFRSFEEAMEGMWKKKAFTVAAGEVYARGMEVYSEFLGNMTVNGTARSKESEDKAERAETVRRMFSQVLGGEEERLVDLWLLDALTPHFDLKLPV